MLSVQTLPSPKRCTLADWGRLPMYRLCETKRRTVNGATDTVLQLHYVLQFDCEYIQALAFHALLVVHTLMCMFTSLIG